MADQLDTVAIFVYSLAHKLEISTQGHPKINGSIGLAYIIYQI